MFIFDLWTNGSLLDKAYVLFFCYTVFLCGSTLIAWAMNPAMKRLNFILDAQRAGRSVPAKLTCLTLEGHFSKSVIKAEYMYAVNNKLYYITYVVDPPIDNDGNKNDFNPDMLAKEFLRQVLMVFYDEKNPEKAFCKAEIFVSNIALRQETTPKHNAYRDVDKIWSEPIDLRKA